jgi:hypothetical protein
MPHRSAVDPSSTSVSRYGTTRSVVQPLLWLTLITTPICVVVSLFATTPLLYALIFLAILPPILVAVAFAGFAIANADRLHSEEFLLQKQWFAAQIGDNTTRSVITLEGQAAEQTPNVSLLGGHDA